MVNRGKTPILLFSLTYIVAYVIYSSPMTLIFRIIVALTIGLIGEFHYLYLSLSAYNSQSKKDY